MDDELIKSKRGRNNGQKIKKRIIITSPRTPVEALRWILGLSITEWSNKVETLPRYIHHYESGHVHTPVRLAKRMQEEARKLGVSITLDELYQNVYPKGYEEEYRQQAFEKASILLKKGAEVRKAALDEKKKKRLAKSQSKEVQN